MFPGVKETKSTESLQAILDRPGPALSQLSVSAWPELETQAKRASARRDNLLSSRRGVLAVLLLAVLAVLKYTYEYCFRPRPHVMFDVDLEKRWILSRPAHDPQIQSCMQGKIMQSPQLHFST